MVKKIPLLSMQTTYSTLSPQAIHSMAILIPALSTCKTRMISGGQKAAGAGARPCASSGIPTLRDKAFAIADNLGQAHQEGYAWGDRAILCADWKTRDLCANALAQRKLPFNVLKRSGDFNPGANAIQIMTMKVIKGLEFPVVALHGVGHAPAAEEDETEAARVFMWRLRGRRSCW